ncbi:protein-disulfide reductase DsbD family protein [Fluviispira multicolorata]|uniref:DUF255 domain-containing protein n=1 Tax=Fluviispira multicolorata TaxID=2654512 RepID=A0A833N222_9BACT|nr:cytochrome c biogenesis protein CcdA [Fluviispira multicolorata]KAB8031927.1 DUF255 domain-containing protein [Fluviispira multicolorata]
MTKKISKKNFNPILYFILTYLFLYTFQVNATNESFYQDKRSIENSAVKITDVVKFQIHRDNNLTENNINILLKTKNNFKIYEDKLKFNIVPKNSFPYEISYTPNKPSIEYKDPFYKKNKRIFQSGTLFTLKNYRAFSHNDKIEIEVQSCSSSICLVPTKLILPLSGNGFAQEIKDDLYFEPQNNKATHYSEKSNNNQNENVVQNQEISNKITNMHDSLALKIQQALGFGSFILFPALFLAGLLMNLTPCVYPMIPITLNVLSQFGTKKSQNKKFHSITLPAIYVFGMVMTYSLLGVFAGMSGNIFGSQLANPIVNFIIAFIMFALGLSMLGFFNLSFLQNIAHKIPLADKYPRIAVGTMGAVSGFISAPCTGPVLSMILVLVAQNKNPITGFTYMFFFAVGFGLPYLILGIFGQKISKLPRFPKLINFTKIFFASLMFALSIYYLRNFLQNITILQNLFYKPNFLNIIILILLSLVFCLLFIKINIIGKLSKIGLIICCSILALWLTLATTSSFILNNNSSERVDTQIDSSIHWIKNFDDAKKLAIKTKKPIIFDVWAEWCTACLEMKKTTWHNKELVDLINTHFIAVQLNYTDSPSDLQILINRWGIVGLPAFGFFNSTASFNETPDVLYQGIVSTQKIIETANRISNNKHL